MPKDEFVILGKSIKKGERAILELEVAKLHTRNSVYITIIVERAKLDGPTLLLLGGVHGDEVNGIAIIRDVIDKKYNKPKRGTVICIPVFNIYGFLNQEREFPDGRDLNRVFPGASNGSLASQFAFQFRKEIAPLVDYVLDFHTGGAHRENFPNVRIAFEDKKSMEIAKIFGAPYIVDSGYIKKSIRAMFRKMNKTIILYEGGKSKSLDAEVIRYGVQGTVNVMKHLKMLEGNVELSAVPIYIDKNKWIRAPFSGLIFVKVKNGIWVKKRTVLAEIRDPYGEFKRKIYAPLDCYIFGVNTASIVNTGDALFHVGNPPKSEV